MDALAAEVDLGAVRDPQKGIEEAVEEVKEKRKDDSEERKHFRRKMQAGLR